MPLLLILIIVPVTELYLLLTLGSWIGAGWTLLVILMTALVGMSLLRSQGLATLFRANQRVQQGEIPLQELAEGFLLALAGAFLITPGLLTDTVGFSLLVPVVRTALARRVGRFLQKRTIAMSQVSTFNQYSSDKGYKTEHSTCSDKKNGSQYNSTSSPRGNVIEGEFERSDNPEKK